MGAPAPLPGIQQESVIEVEVLTMAADDVKPFLERQADAALLTRENLRKLLGEA